MNTPTTHSSNDDRFETYGCGLCPHAPGMCARGCDRLPRALASGRVTTEDMIAESVVDSTPAPNVDGTTPAPWKVTRPAAIRAVCEALTGEADVYVETDGKTPKGLPRVWIGLRDNRDRNAHAGRLDNLFAALKAVDAAPFTVRRVNRDGRTIGLRLTGRA